MENEHLSAKQSLILIQSMIDKTKTQLGDNSIYFLMWGWLVLIGCLLQYFLMVVIHYPHHYYAWFVIIIGVVFSTVYSIRHKKYQQVKTYVGESMEVLWSGMSITFVALVIILSQIGWNYAFPFYMLLYATGTFISGGILKFKPLQIGGITCWILAVGACYVSYQNQILFTAMAILASYLIPGYLLKRTREKTS